MIDHSGEGGCAEVVAVLEQSDKQCLCSSDLKVAAQWELTRAGWWIIDHRGEGGCVEVVAVLERPERQHLCLSKSKSKA